MAVARSPVIFERGAHCDVLALATQAAHAQAGFTRAARPRWRPLARWARWGAWGHNVALIAPQRDDSADHAPNPVAGEGASSRINSDGGHDGPDDEGIGHEPGGAQAIKVNSTASAPVVQVNATATTPARLLAQTSLSADYEAFIRQHERAILNYLWRMTGDEQTAYDLTQEVFLRAWQRFDALRRYDQPRSWLFRVATNLAITHIRRRALPVGSATPLDTALDSERDPASSDPAWRLAESDQVRRTLLQLSPQRRAALVLREVYGLSAAEVGQTLGITPVAVRMALHRAREQFRALYLREEGGEADAH